MSLDVCLIIKKSNEVCTCDACGHKHKGDVIEYLYGANITHNLGRMAEKAGIYEALWRPHRLRGDYNIRQADFTAEDEFEASVVIRAKEIIPYLEKGLADLKARPTYYEQFNSTNGWGLYKHFVPFVEKYLSACKKHPDAIVEVSR